MNPPDKQSKADNIKKIIQLLRFVLTIDDEEIIQSSIESVIEMLEEEIN